MQEEMLSRAEKIEMARKSVDKRKIQKKVYQSGIEEDIREEEQSFLGSYFFLRVLLSGFLLLAFMGVTRFDAMGKEQANIYQTKIIKALKTQKEVDKFKEFIQTIK